MMAWLPVVVLAIAQIAVRAIGVAGMIWRERARAQGNCEQMRMVSGSGVVFFERRENGAGVLIVPAGLPDNDGRGGTGAAGPGQEGTPAS